jgi:hypothetical protein
MHKQLGGVENCYRHSTAAEENGMRVEITSKHAADFCRIHIDGCLLDSQTDNKCDYVFVKSGSENQFLFVELKRSGDLTHAATQIFALSHTLTANFHYDASKNAAVSFRLAYRAKLTKSFNSFKPSSLNAMAYLCVNTRRWHGLTANTFADKRFVGYLSQWAINLSHDTALSRLKFEASQCTTHLSGDILC